MSEELKKLTQNTVDATITLSSGDEINLELYPDLAPDTVENFISLANEGFYDGTIFHRVIPGFVIQGGGYDEDLNSLKADTIIGEFTSNGFVNELPHERGVISMARISSDPDSATSQFFIMLEDTPALDGDYAAFGKVKDDMSLAVIDDIAMVRTGSVSSVGLEDVPVSPVVIRSITISSSDESIPQTKSKKSSDDEDEDIFAIDDDEEDDDDDELTEAEIEKIEDMFSTDKSSKTTS
ncbi:MAG: peptidylprolyl isomerase [Clostridia bacterium]|nr:peptidylprolyl isomerase [Clostridia bacterium]